MLNIWIVNLDILISRSILAKYFDWYAAGYPDILISKVAKCDHAIYFQIMVGVQDMTSDQVRKRSASVPPKKVGAEPGTTTDQQLDDQYLAGLIKRTAHLPLDVIEAKPALPF